MYHPPRGGVRGGRDQFNWEDVKTDKHRENYLGHSLFAPVGRWQQGKDLTWYSKDGEKDQVHLNEIKAIKEAEADVMAEFLGAGKRKIPTASVSQQELSNILKKEAEENEEDDENIVQVQKEASKGLGFKSSGRLSLGEMLPTDASSTIPLLENSPHVDEQNLHLTAADDSNRLIATNTMFISGIHQTINTEERSRDKDKKKKKEKKEKKHKKEKHRKKKSRRSPSSTSVSGEEDRYNNVSSINENRHRRHKHVSPHRKVRVRHKSLSRSSSPLSRSYPKHHDSELRDRSWSRPPHSRSRSPPQSRDRQFRHRSPQSRPSRYSRRSDRSRSRSPYYSRRNHSPSPPRSKQRLLRKDLTQERYREESGYPRDRYSHKTSHDRSENTSYRRGDSRDEIDRPRLERDDFPRRK